MFLFIIIIIFFLYILPHVVFPEKFYANTKMDVLALKKTLQNASILNISKTRTVGLGRQIK
jgi:hypothetical protein